MAFDGFFSFEILWQKRRSKTYATVAMLPVKMISARFTESGRLWCQSAPLSIVTVRLQHSRLEMCGVCVNQALYFVSSNTSSFCKPSLITVTMMPPMESNDHINWLPGLGSQSHSFPDMALAPPAKLETGFNTKAAKVVDEEQNSIVCHDCGKHFWRRSTADSHAALTAHVLHEDIISPSSPVIVPSSPTATWASAPRMNTSLSSATDAETSPNTDILDQGNIGDEEYSICSECGGHFWSYDAANIHARMGHMQDIEMVPSSVSDASHSPTFSATVLAVTPTFPATASHPAIRGTAPTSPPCTTEHTRGAFSPTSPIDYEDNIPASAYGTTSPTSGHATALLWEYFAHPTVPDVSQRVCILSKKFCC